jgi:hypothetical protein
MAPETDPQALLHQLMQVSHDCTVPPDLIDRLRQVEEQLYTEFQALLEEEGDN